jgi:glycogen phosphorylase
VLDGWWGEGYNGHNGWGITPRSARFDYNQRLKEEANDLLDIIEHEVLPTYFRRDGGGYSADWVAISKASMKTTIPRFNSQRMLRDYVTKLYWPARQQRRKLEANGAEVARSLAAWKHRVRNAWTGVSMELMLMPPAHLYHDDKIELRVRAQLNGLQPGDVRLECLLGSQDAGGEFVVAQKVELEATGGDAQFTDFSIEVTPEIAGLQYYKLRMYPFNEALSHPFEMGFMIWI